jgi:hypothetical protein
VPLIGLDACYLIEPLLPKSAIIVSKSAKNVSKSAKIEIKMFFGKVI